MELGLDGKVAFVAGASRGLGLATAEALAREGARVAFAARTVDEAHGHAQRYPGAIAVPLDLLDADSITAAAGQTRQRLGEIDVLVLNGGGPPPGAADAVTTGEARAAEELLLHGHLALVAECLPGMRQRGWGRIVAVGSSGVQQPIPNLAASSMARASLAAYLKLLAGDVAGDGVTVNMALPGRIATDRLAQIDQATATREGQPLQDVQRSAQQAIPVGRYGTPDEFAAAVTFLASTCASYITGVALRVDGGLVRVL